MLAKLKKYKDSRSSEGFTIIEVMIVLAIAGLILLIVFLAVPALQRNARNTQRNTDVGSLIGAFNEYVDNQNGTVPTASCTGATPCAWLTNAKTGFYGNGGWTATSFVYTYSAAAQALADPNNGNNVLMGNYMGCNAAGTASANGTSARNVAILYDVEVGGGGLQEECKTVD